MPHVISRSTGPEARFLAAQSPPFGPGCAPDLVTRTETVTVTGSSFADAGGDWVEFTLADSTGTVISTKRIPGY